MGEHSTGKRSLILRFIVSIHAMILNKKETISELFLTPLIFLTEQEGVFTEDINHTFSYRIKYWVWPFHQPTKISLKFNC